MNVPTIAMDPEQARQKLRAFREARHKDAEAEYAAAVAGYEQLAAGRTLVLLGEAIRAGGFDEKHRPRLAVCRADRKEVMYRAWGRDHEAVFEANATAIYSVAGKYSPELVRRVEIPEEQRKWVQAYAMVPMVPPDVRPATGQLRDWYILWEVDEWSDRPRTAPPPRDPYLLQHVRGDLYAVLAEWDLTDLERAVMAEIRGPQPGRMAR